jgi:ribosomal protein L39E
MAIMTFKWMRLVKIQVQNMQITSWILIEKQQLVKLNLGTKAYP